jgi:hypothetical protein
MTGVGDNLLIMTFESCVPSAYRNHALGLRAIEHADGLLRQVHTGQRSHAHSVLSRSRARPGNVAGLPLGSRQAAAGIIAHRGKRGEPDGNRPGPVGPVDPSIPPVRRPLDLRPPPRSSPRPSSSQIVPPAEAPAGSTRAARWEPDSLRSGQPAVHLHYSTSVLRRIPGPVPRPTIGWGKAVTHKQTNRREVLGPFLTVLDGTPVPHAELVAGGRRMAEILVAHGRPLTLGADDHWAGVWDLERLTDDEAAAWGLWVAMKVRPSHGLRGRRTGAPE